MTETDQLHFYHPLNYANQLQVTAMYHSDTFFPIMAEIIKNGGNIGSCPLYTKFKEQMDKGGFTEIIEGYGKSMKDIAFSPEMEIGDMYLTTMKPVHLDKCPVCGVDTKPEWDECPMCVNEVSLYSTPTTPTPPAPDAPTECPNCQAPLEPAFKRCPSCKASLVAAPPPPPPPPPAGSPSPTTAPSSGLTAPCGMCGQQTSKESFATGVCEWCQKNPSEKTMGDKALEGFGKGMAGLTTGAVAAGEGINAVNGARSTITNAVNAPPPPPPPAATTTLCINCAGPLVYLPEHSRHYCHACGGQKGYQ